MAPRIAIIASFVILALGGLVLFIAKPSQTGSGQPLIGGPFTLTNHLGETVTQDSYGNKALLIYFGFTFCPDVCPTELSKVSQALDMIDAKTLAKLQPLFMTVDPQRDTVEQMALYVSNFHPSIVGLTGTPEQVKAATKAYRIYAAKVDDDSSTDGYTMDHSSILYLMDANNEYLAHFTQRESAADMAARITALLD